MLAVVASFLISQWSLERFCWDAQRRSNVMGSYLEVLAFFAIPLFSSERCGVSYLCWWRKLANWKKPTSPFALSVYGLYDDFIFSKRADWKIKHGVISLGSCLTNPNTKICLFWPALPFGIRVGSDVALPLSVMLSVSVLLFVGCMRINGKLLSMWCLVSRSCLFDMV